MSHRHSRGAAPTTSASIRGTPKGLSETQTEANSPTQVKPTRGWRITTKAELHTRQELARLRKSLARVSGTPLDIYRKGDILSIGGQHWQVYSPSLLIHDSSDGHLPYIAFHVMVIPFSGDPELLELAEDPALKFPNDIYTHSGVIIPVYYDMIRPPPNGTRVQVEHNSLRRVGDVTGFQIIDPTANYPTLEVLVDLLSRDDGEKVVLTGIHRLENLFPNPYMALGSEREFPARYVA